VTTGERAYVAVDLGAGSGRVIVGRVQDGRITLEEVHRFVHEVRTLDGHERWDFARILAEVERGLALAGRAAVGTLASVGVDGWGVDHGFLDGTASPRRSDPAPRRARAGMLSDSNGIA
jgi:rhamnulokinase